LVRGRPLYTGRRPRVAVLESGKWSHPADPMAAMPPRYSRFVEAPKLMAHGAGRVWRAVQSRISTAQNRTDFWANPGRWGTFLTAYEGDRWRPAVLLGSVTCSMPVL
jgi:hypothetical protein